MQTDEAGRRLIFLSIPFLGFGLVMALRPPAADTLGPGATGVVQALGVSLVLLALGAIVTGIWLIRQDEERIL